MLKKYKYLILIFLLFSLTFFISCDVSNEDHQNIKNTEKYQWHNTTIWNIEPDYALDVLCLLNVLTGDSFYVRYYEDDFHYFKKQFTPEIKKAIASLNYKVRIKNKQIITFLATHFSSVNPSTINDLLYFLRNSHEIEALGQLKNDEFIMDKVANHNPNFGYNSFWEFITGDIVKAMDQIINEKLAPHKNLWVKYLL